MSEIQTELCNLLEAKKMSLADLAAKTGRAYSDIRRSLYEPHWWRLDRLLEYAEALEVSVDKLFPSHMRGDISLTGGEDRICSAGVEERMAAAAYAGAAVRWLNQVGRHRRQKYL